MAVKAKKKSGQGTFTEQDESVLRVTLAGVENLYKRHAAEIARIRRESETDRMTVNYVLQADFSESVPSVEIGIRYTQTYTDKIVTNLPDPNQMDLPIEFMSAAEAKAKAKDAKDSDGDDGEDD